MIFAPPKNGVNVAGAVAASGEVEVAAPAACSGVFGGLGRRGVFHANLFALRPFTTSTSASTSAFGLNDRQIFHFAIFEF